MSQTPSLEAMKDKIDSFLVLYPVIDEPLKKVAASIKVEKAYIFTAACALPVLLMYFVGIGHVIIDLIGFVYPLYASIKAVETKDKDDDTQWLTYWIIFSIFKITEGVADFLISFIPFYFLLKAFFLVWCYHPSTKGAQQVYNAVIKPYIVPAINDFESKTAKSE